MNLDIEPCSEYQRFTYLHKERLWSNAESVQDGHNGYVTLVADVHHVLLHRKPARQAIDHSVMRTDNSI
jgi:hypothetical protein